MAMETQSSSWFLMPPEEGERTRRGDPLGFRELADFYADQFAPDLSNRTVDGRWMSILCWAIRMGNRAHSKTNKRSSNDGLAREREIYDWIQPLLLLWTARTVRLGENGGKGRQLPQVTGVRTWCKKREATPQFGLSPDQYRKYRWTGPFGAYRAAMRELGLTDEGGSSLTGAGELLAGVIQGNVGTLDLPDPGKSGPNTYWRNTWKSWDKAAVGRKNLLPTHRNSPARLSKGELKVLAAVLFGKHNEKAVRRAAVVTALKSMSTTADDATFYRTLASRLKAKPFRGVELLERFVEIADAGVEAMNAIWRALRAESTELSTLADKLEVKSTLRRLRESARRWPSHHRASLDGLDAVHHLATSVRGKHATVADLVKRLINHHHTHKGGLEWFQLDGGRVVRVAPNQPSRTSLYRFRLWSLARLAVQCGRLHVLPKALSPEVDPLDQDEEDGQ